ncbi:sigma-70 family RNA polymerase sigma factor [Nakamurella silvestris]|nr:sigma-70 family RNA polymerase sigma factor [Nakamurella silvestris]
MPATTLSALFEEQRGRLTAVAARILGSRADAEDAVQEAWLRLSRQDVASIESLPGWLNTVVSRLCIDLLRTRKAHAEVAIEAVPEWVVTFDDGGGPEAGAVLTDTVGAALLVVADALTPDERVAFVLHDLFSVPFAEVGEILGKSTDAAKMLASRARRKVRDAENPVGTRHQGEVVDAFLAAARDGDFDGLMRILDPEVTWRIHTARGDIVRSGAANFADQARRGAQTGLDAARALVNGRPGVVAWRADGRPFAVMECTVVDGLIFAAESVTDPARLAAMRIPRRPA